MTMPRSAATFAPPVMEARRWLAGLSFSDDKPLINVSQAAPVAPPPEALRHHIAQIAVSDPNTHLYGPVLGLPELREEVATQWSTAYDGSLKSADVAITSGCNQAFSAALTAIAGEGDEVILPTPWYFNHKMWLDMQGLKAVPLASWPDLLPDPTKAAALITPRTRAIVLVTPNNPGGVEYPAALVRDMYTLAKSHGLKLIVDETYRDFDSRTTAPHDLFGDPDWRDTLIHLYSFSKAYRLTGHRVGAMVADPATLAEAEKFLDTVAICPNQLGQHAALWGMRHLADWLADERLQILDRRAAISDNLPKIHNAGWKLLGAGAYFAYFEHPSPLPSDQLAQQMVREHAILTLPGTMFTPAEDPMGARTLRVAFANVDRREIGTLFDRLAQIAP